MNKPEAIFVVGMPRSGTTLLASLLNAHSEVAISPETDYFSFVWKPLARSGGWSAWPVVAAHLQRFFEQRTVRLMELPESELMDQFHELWTAGALSHTLMLSSMLAWYAERSGKVIWGEKTPDHFMYVPAIKSLVPNAHIVSIVRDPRDIHLSLDRVPWSRGNALNHAIQWRGYRSMAQHFAELYDKTFVEVRYEDLIGNPQGTLEQLCQRLELAFEPEMLDLYQNSRLFDPNDEPWKVRAASAIDPNNREKWRGTMSSEDLAVFTRVCGKYLTRWGYDAPHETLKPSHVLHNLEWRPLMWWMRTNWRVKHGRDPWLGSPLASVTDERC